MIYGPPPVEIHKDKLKALISSHILSDEGEASSEPASPIIAGRGWHILISRLTLTEQTPPTPTVIYSSRLDFSNLRPRIFNLRLLDIDQDQYFEALIDLSRWENDYMFRQLREVVNRTDWRSHGTVTEVNAFYVPWENSMSK
ncbi:NEDD8 protease nep2 [Homalodisca vitripennis]|nr:NEDD8 protease nep2 [Homalodisca vitripennis]